MSMCFCMVSSHSARPAVRGCHSWLVVQMACPQSFDVRSAFVQLMRWGGSSWWNPCHPYPAIHGYFSCTSRGNRIIIKELKYDRWIEVTSRKSNCKLCMTCLLMNVCLSYPVKTCLDFSRGNELLKHPTQKAWRFDDTTQAQSRGLLSLGLLTWSTQLASIQSQKVTCRVQVSTWVRLPHRHASQSLDGDAISDESAEGVRFSTWNLFLSADLFHSFAGRLARVVLVEQIYRAQEIRRHREGISRGELKTYAV